MTFKNTGSVAFHYEWNVLLDQECSNPPELSSVAELIEINSSKNLLPREHYLQGRPNIFCAKNKGKVLPGEVVSTLFVFSSNAIVGAVTESWLLNTIPTANVAMDSTAAVSDSLLENNSNNIQLNFHPMLLSALTATTNAFKKQELEYDTLSPIRICIRGHIQEIDSTYFKREKTGNKILFDSKITEINDTKQIISRKIRDPVKVSHIKQRKIKLFERINYALFQQIFGDTYGCVPPLIITKERMDLFENICGRINDFLPKAVIELNDIKFKESLVFEHELIIMREEEGISHMNKNSGDLKRMFLELFPEKKIVCDVLVIFNYFLHFYFLYSCEYHNYFRVFIVITVADVIILIFSIIITLIIAIAIISVFYLLLLLSSL